MYSVLKGLDISFRDATLQISVVTSGYELVLPLVSNQPVRYDLEKVIFPLLNTHDIFSLWDHSLKTIELLVMWGIL